MDRQKEEITVLLVEDELVTRDLIASWIVEHPSLRLKGMAGNGSEALSRLKSERYDLLFLDIDLPLLSGWEVLEELEEIPYLIFITVSAEHAVRAFDLGALDYLHKPFGKERFLKAVERALERIHSASSDPDPSGSSKRGSGPGIFVSEGENHYLIPISQIIYIASHGGRSVIHTEERDLETAKSILELERRVPPDQLMRIHKQFLLNLSFISHVQYLIGGRYQVYLKDQDETSLPVGRKYAARFKSRLGL